MNAQKQKTLIGIKKAQSLLDKIVTMVEQDEYCIDIMQQTLSVIGLLKGVGKLLLEGHLRSCFSRAIDSGNATRKKEMIEEILTISQLANK